MKIITVFFVSMLLAVGVVFGILVYMGYSVSDVLFFTIRESLALIFLATIVTILFIVYQINRDRQLGPSSLILGVIVITLIMGWGTYVYVTKGRMLKETLVFTKKIPFKTIIQLPVMDMEGTTTYENAYIWHNSKTDTVRKISLAHGNTMNSSIDIAQVSNENDMATQYYRNTYGVWNFYWYTTLYKKILSSDTIYTHVVHYFVLLIAMSLSMVSGLFLTRLFKYSIITIIFIVQWYMGISVLAFLIAENYLVLELLLLFVFVAGYSIYKLARYNNKHDISKSISNNDPQRDIDYIYSR